VAVVVEFKMELQAARAAQAEVVPAEEVPKEQMELSIPVVAVAVEDLLPRVAQAVQVL
jgi:hypothetical protein